LTVTLLKEGETVEEIDAILEQYFRAKRYLQTGSDHDARLLQYATNTVVAYKRIHDHEQILRNEKKDKYEEIKKSLVICNQCRKYSKKLKKFVYEKKCSKKVKIKCNNYQTLRRNIRRTIEIDKELHFLNLS